MTPLRWFAFGIIAAVGMVLAVLVVHSYIESQKALDEFSKSLGGSFSSNFIGFYSI